MSLTIATAVAGAWVAVAATAPGFAEVDCRSPALGGHLPVAVFLPVGYATSRLRYPVIYYLHGLPAGPQLYKESGFIAAAARASGHEAIVVAPQGSRSANGDREYLDWGRTENWPQAIASDLPTCIDSRFRTIATRTGRALVGLSAGGFGAFNIGFRRLSQFAAVESWSGYFAATDPSGWHVLKFGSPAASAAARVPPAATIAAQVKRLPTFIAFYVGNGDSRFRQDNVALDHQLSRQRVPHWFATYPGGHWLSLWAREAPLWLGRALAFLAAPLRGSAGAGSSSGGGAPVTGGSGG